MRCVGIKQLKDEAPALIASGETLVIERRGTPVAVVVPLEAVDRERKVQAMDDLGEAIRAFLDKYGIDEAEFEAHADDERVEIACGGGTGRTGTALALLAVWGGVRPDDAVAWVRAHYRPRAAETPWQRRWVRRTGARTVA